MDDLDLDIDEDDIELDDDEFEVNHNKNDCLNRLVWDWCWGLGLVLGFDSGKK